MTPTLEQFFRVALALKRIFLSLVHSWAHETSQWDFSLLPTPKHELSPTRVSGEKGNILEVQGCALLLQLPVALMVT